MRKDKITIAEVQSAFVQSSGGMPMIRGSMPHVFARLLLESVGVVLEDCPFDGNHNAVLWCGTCQWRDPRSFLAGDAGAYKSVKKVVPNWLIEVHHHLYRDGFKRLETHTARVTKQFPTRDDALQWAKREYPTAFKIEIERTKDV